MTATVPRKRAVRTVTAPCRPRVWNSQRRSRVQVATLVIAVVGLVLGAISLAWQAAIFVLTGPRVKVRLQEGFRGPLGVMFGPASMCTETGRQTLANEGYTEHVLAIDV